MNSIIEKEKKLNQTLEKLKNLDLAKKDNSPELENLKAVSYTHLTLPTILLV